MREEYLIPVVDMGLDKDPTEKKDQFIPVVDEETPLESVYPHINMDTRRKHE